MYHQANFTCRKSDKALVTAANCTTALTSIVIVVVMGKNGQSRLWRVSALSLLQSAFPFVQSDEREARFCESQFHLLYDEGESSKLFLLIAAIVKHKFSLFPSTNRIDSHSPTVPRLSSSLFDRMAVYSRQRHLLVRWTLAILTGSKQIVYFRRHCRSNFKIKVLCPSDTPIHTRFD